MTREIKIDFLKIEYEGDEAGMKAVMAGIGEMFSQMVQQAVEQPEPPTKRRSKVVTDQQPRRVIKARLRKAQP